MQFFESFWVQGPTNCESAPNNKTKPSFASSWYNSLSSFSVDGFWPPNELGGFLTPIVYTKNIKTKDIIATELGSLKAVATCQRGNPTLAENEARYLREQTGISVPGRPRLLVEGKRVLHQKD